MPRCSRPTWHFGTDELRDIEQAFADVRDDARGLGERTAPSRQCYLKEENRVLRELHGKKRLRFNREFGSIRAANDRLLRSSFSDEPRPPKELRRPTIGEGRAAWALCEPHPSPNRRGRFGKNSLSRHEVRRGGQVAQEPRGHIGRCHVREGHLECPKGVSGMAVLA